MVARPLLAAVHGRDVHLPRVVDGVTTRPHHRARTRCAITLQAKLRSLSIWDSRWDGAVVFHLWDQADAAKVGRSAPGYALHGDGYYLALGDGPLEAIGRRAPAAHRYVRGARRLARPRPSWPTPSPLEVIQALTGIVGLAGGIRGLLK